MLYGMKCTKLMLYEEIASVCSCVFFVSEPAEIFRYDLVLVALSKGSWANLLLVKVGPI